MNKRQKKKFEKRNRCRTYHHRKWCRAHMDTTLSNLAKEVAMMMSSKAYYTEKEDTAKKYVSYINDLLEGTPYMLLEDSVKINERGNLACEVVRKPTFTIDINVGDNIPDDIIKEVSDNE